MCHCLACQRRTGSAFGIQARWPRERVQIEGEATEYIRISDEGEERSFFFCPRCGATVSCLDRLGANRGADRCVRRPKLPGAACSVWENRMHPWVGLPEGIEHIG